MGWLPKFGKGKINAVTPKTTIIYERKDPPFQAVGEELRKRLDEMLKDLYNYCNKTDAKFFLPAGETKGPDVRQAMLAQTDNFAEQLTTTCMYVIHQHYFHANDTLVQNTLPGKKTVQLEIGYVRDTLIPGTEYQISELNKAYEAWNALYDQTNGLLSKRYDANTGVGTTQDQLHYNNFTNLGKVIRSQYTKLFAWLEEYKKIIKAI